MPSKDDIKPAADKMQEWWEQCHNTPDSYYISDYGGPSLWKRLKISKLIVPAAPVLDIGVGGGTDIRCLHEKGLEVHVLDITPTAFERVAGCYEKAWLEPELESLPRDYFAVVISHLVTQHINDSTLERQIRHVLKALRPDGVFAMQYCDGSPSIKAKDYDESVATCQVGDVRRTPKMMKALVKRCGGRVTWVSKPEPYPEHRKQWFYTHIRRARKHWWSSFFSPAGTNDL